MLKAHRYWPTLLLAVSVLASAPACAARIYSSGSYGYGNGYNQEFQRRAYESGYRDGRDRGWDDVRHQRTFGYWRLDVYRDADRGYHRGDGEREVYRQSFRQGFQTGYSEAFNGRR